MHLLITLMLLLMAASPAAAGELFGFYGSTNQVGKSHTSFANLVEYRQGLGENLAASIAVLNEGHLPNHHRDGLVPVMLWGRSNRLERQLSLAVGAGPYIFADTITPPEGGKNDHNVGALVGLSATWYFENRLLLQARANWVIASHSIDTVSTLIGIGYQLDPPPGPGPRAKPLLQREKTTRNELTLFFGQTVVNNPGTPASLAWSAEYRRGIFPYLDISAAWLDEGNNRLIHRQGVSSQLWLGREFLDKHLALGAGIGAYVAADQLDSSNSGTEGNTFVASIISMTASVRNFELAPQLIARFTMNRVVTKYDKDSDTFMLGLGYAF